jgi:hypothetical protein
VVQVPPLPQASVPVLQAPPAQQGLPFPPHVWQPEPETQTLVAEQAPPTATQLPPVQQPLFWHRGLFAQHAPPATPQVHAPPVQMLPFEHLVVSATHVEPPGSQHPVPLHAGAVEQHVALTSPHGGTHVPFVHVPPLEVHVALFATHDVPSQQPPFAHAVPLVQHAPPRLPQFWQVPLLHVPFVQARPAPTQMFPPAVSQQAAVAPEPLHVLFAQHPDPAVPHAAHTPEVPLHTEPACEHCVPSA